MLFDPEPDEPHDGYPSIGGVSDDSQRSPVDDLLGALADIDSLGEDAVLAEAGMFGGW